MKTHFRIFGFMGIALAFVSARSLAAEEPAPQAQPPKKERARYLDGLGRNAEEQKALDELSNAMRAYEDAWKEFRKEVQNLIEKIYEEKRKSLDDSYEKAIRDLEVV